MPSPIAKSEAATMEPKKSGKLGTVSGVYIPVCLNILSILMFLRFGVILGQVGFIGILGLLLTSQLECHLTPNRSLAGGI